jgi:hypothetical protein
MLLALVGLASIVVVGLLLSNQLLPPPPYSPLERTTDFRHLVLATAPSWPFVTSTGRIPGRLSFSSMVAPALPGHGRQHSSRL